MNIYTLNVGQGQFVVVVGNEEAFIVDTYLPLNPKFDIVHIKSALANILKDKNLIGLIVTGFDDDHFNEIGLKVVLHKYLPNWIMYPKYFKETGNADACFEAIASFEGKKKFERISVSLKKNNTRFYNKLSSEFAFEIFSPHVSDMNSSNNCSLVCKVKERSTGATYLITGDTENDRWESIVENFGSSIFADVLDAPHHGSKNGVSESAISLINPSTVLVSAGVQNQYGHPDAEATKLFETYANNWYSTSHGGGQSILTVANGGEVKNYKFCP
jgi:beta-lactamase superfamily II metal-dependent hydrolase